MNTLRNKRGLSTLSLIILLLASCTIGAILSYLWTVGYYVKEGHTIPEDVATIAITSVSFPVEDSNYFDVTVLNPSYSYGEARVTDIAFIVDVGGEEVFNNIPTDSIDPQVPYILGKGETVTFRCNKNWGEYAGQNVRVLVFLQSDSGATFPHETGKVKLLFVKADIATEVSIERFDVTIRNAAESLIPVDISEILFGSIRIPPQNVTVRGETATLPQQLQQNETKTFTCEWNLLENGVLGIISSSHTITIKTLQGYSASKTETLPAVVSLNVSDVSFTNLPDSSGFNVTISNHPASPHFVNVSRITITNGSQVFDNVTVTEIFINSTIPGGPLPALLVPGGNLTLQCLWSWEAFKGKTAIITVHTSQGYDRSIYKTFPGS